MNLVMSSHKKRRSSSLDRKSKIPKAELDSSTLFSLDDSFFHSADFSTLDTNLSSLSNSFLNDINVSLKRNSFNDVFINTSNNSFDTKPNIVENSVSYGVPENIRNLLSVHKNIDKLYEWQEEVLNLKKLNDRNNLLLILPTSGGKTLIAEVLILKELLYNFKNVLFVLPYVSLVHEKINSLSPFAVQTNFLIEEYAGNKGKFPPVKRRNKNTLFISTIEKSDILINSLIEEDRFSEIGLIVVDEFHLIGESIRGAIIESILIKGMNKNPSMQIVALSATIGNPNELADFLNGFVYTNNFRPVNLFEFVKIEDEIFKVNYDNIETPLEFVKKFKNKASYKHLDIDPDCVGYLVREVVPLKSCLVFCPSKKNCENIAELLCKTFSLKTLEYKKEEKKCLLKHLLSEGNGNICKILNRTIPFGVAYHHSGLTTPERKILEEAFLNNLLCCICCTSTLAAGVNLPAARVILRSPYVGASFISFNQYKQMAGRAGRAGMEEKGECYLLAKALDSANIFNLVSSKVGNCVSQLKGGGLNKLIMSCLSLEIAHTRQEIINVVSKSLLKLQTLEDTITSEVDIVLNDLIETGTVLYENDILKLTNVGKASIKANITVECAQLLLRDLTEAKSKLILSSHLHLLYLVTPYDVELKPSHDVLVNVLLSLDREMIKVANNIGISDATITKIAMGRTVPSTSDHKLKRFYASIILNELVSGKNLWQVSKKFDLDRGTVFAFISSASSFASAVIRFCEVFQEEMWCFIKLLADYPQKISFCCSQELIPLMELPAVRLGRARQLYNAGFKDLSLIAKCDPKELSKSIELLPYKQAKVIVSSAKMILISKADLLQEEAESLINCLQSN